jgi:sigma-B regulation protein RsbU (phosphoserine phosphatase)
MALGIQEDIHLEDHRVLLSVGDCVILYTDGVTEAFSPQDEMYGEERLHETIRLTSCDSADIILEAIDRSVIEFIGDYPRADDLTMVAIRRVSS